MLKCYEDELNELKERMIKAEEFSNRVPAFAEFIINRKYTGEENWIDFGHEINGVVFDSRIHYGRFVGYASQQNEHTHYRPGNPRRIENLNEDHDEFLFAIGINPYIGSDRLETYGIEKIQNEVDVFFFDEDFFLFYVEQEHLNEFVAAIDKWKKNAQIKYSELTKEQEIAKLESKIKELKGE